MRSRIPAERLGGQVGGNPTSVEVGPIFVVPLFRASLSVSQGSIDSALETLSRHALLRFETLKAAPIVSFVLDLDLRAVEIKGWSTTSDALESTGTSGYRARGVS